jgi:N-methylhydantoinase A
VTDAHLVLGHLPASLLGGRMTLDPALAEQAIGTRVAEPLGLSLHEAARGILAIADSNMVGAIRVVSVERGHDPRDFTLVPFGGAGPLHGCALAELLGITRVLVPPAPGVLCAEGLLAASLKSEFSRTLPRPDEWDTVDQVLAALDDEARAWFDTEHVASADRETTRVALLRYEGQGAELAIAWPGSADAARAEFAKAHQALNGFTLDAKVELVTLRVEAEGRTQAPKRSFLPRGKGAAPIGRQMVHGASGSFEASVYERASLGADDQFAGPSIVTQLDATTLIQQGWQAEALASGALMLRRV